MSRWVRWVGTIIGNAVTLGNARIIVNVHPRIGKSELLSFWTPTWYLDHHPEKSVMLISHTDELAKDFGRRVRNEFDANPSLQTLLRADSKAAGRWNTPEGGGMYCAGIEGSITGRGFHLGIVDDPIKNWQDAYSPTVQQQQRDWWRSTFRTRAEPGASIVVIMHRWHEEDLTGWLVAEQPDLWTVFRLPALAEDNDPMGREAGQALCPERFDTEALRATRVEFGEEVWAAMFQQAPLAVRAGRTYDHFSPTLNIKNDIALRRDLPLHLSMDFNINPGMHMEVGQYHEKADVFSCVHEIHGPRMNVEQATEAFVRLVQQLGGWQWPELHIFGDATGTSEWEGTSESLYQVLLRGLAKLRCNIRRRVRKANPPVIDRVLAVNDAMRDADGRVHYFAHPRCERLITDLKLLRPAEDGLPSKTDRKLSHASDAEGYRVHYLRPLRQRIEVPRGRYNVKMN